MAVVRNVFFYHALLLVWGTLVIMAAADPSAKPWPEQFHAQLYQNRTGELAVIDLWYDWPNGRNLNIIQHQLGKSLFSLEWTNGTSFYYDLEAKSCKVYTFFVGILRPDWLDNATYLGVQMVDGFKCNVWTKADFITYYEDVVSKKPVLWIFYNAMEVHVITFEEGRALEDKEWQSPCYCFDGSQGKEVVTQSVLGHFEPESSVFPWTRSMSVAS